MAVWTTLDRMFQAGIKTPTVLFANAAISLRGRDGRCFSVDPIGNWINRQEQATFVSPTVHAARYETVRLSILDAWCHTYTPSAGDVVFDIGAGIGDEAVIFSHLVPDGRVYAVEAHPRTFACMQRTAELSGVANVTLLPCALADKDGSLSISTGLSHVSNTIMNGGDIEVPARSLSSLCRELNIGRIDFLKMNIEGAERLAVQGFDDLDIRHIAISCHDFIADMGGGDFYRTREEVLRALRSLGYRITERDHPSHLLRAIVYADKV